MGDHDGLFKLGFGDPVHAAGELRSVLPAGIVDAIALDQLERVAGSFVDEALAQRHTDLLFRAPRRDTGEPLYLYFLIEHQSEPDRWMPLRVLGYVLRIWETLLRDESPRYLFVPAMHLLIDDLVEASDAELQVRPLAPFQRLVLWFLRDVRRPEHFVAGLRGWDALVAAIAEVDDVSLLIALRYLREVAGPAPFEEFRRRVVDLAPSQESLMITAAQFDFERGRERGVQEGLEKGLRASVAALLVQRFGPLDEAAQAWIAQAAAPQLSRALARVLTAPTVAAAVADE